MFFHYGEDRNYCQRVLFHNFKIGVLPNSFMIHDREYRETKKIQIFSEEFYNEKLKGLKIHYGDVNLTDSNRKKGLAKRLGKARSSQTKALYKLNFKSASKFKKLADLIAVHSQPILTSVENNRSKGPHYLQIEDKL